MPQMSCIVPNLQPVELSADIRLAVVGEQPGEAEQSWRKCSRNHGFPGLRFGKANLRCWCGSGESISTPEPFVGPAGDLLMQLLKDNGLRREQVFLGNVSQLQLRAGTLDECRDDVSLLAADLERFVPNAILVMGGLALEAFKGVDHISRWRGSITQGKLGGKSYKLVCANNPAAVLYQPSDLCFLRLDVKRAVEEARTPELSLPSRRIVLKPAFNFVMSQLDEIRLFTHHDIGFDIEGGCDVGVTVLSFAILPDFVFSIPFKRLDFSPVWSKEQEAIIWKALRTILESEHVVKVGHNIAYEMFVLAWLYGIRMKRVEDTMLLWHSLWCEHDKGLDVLASVLTRQPHWGVAGEWKTDDERDCYNATDSSVTLECWQAMQAKLNADTRKYYEFQRSLLEPTLEMQLRGVAWDAEAAKRLAAELEQESFSVQGKLDQIADIGPPSFEEVRDAVAMKVHHKKCRDWSDLVTYAKPSFRE